MISFTQAQQKIQEIASSKVLGAEKVSLEHAVFRILAEDIFVPFDVPTFDNAAMDGFAVYCTDLAAATSEFPISLPKAGIVAAKNYNKLPVLNRGTCLQVMTGAPVPIGTEAVIPVEDVLNAEKHIIYKSLPAIGAHIRLKGQDFSKGNCFLTRGTKISKAHIMVLATLGCAEVTVFKKPNVLFISTGAEIVDDMASPLNLGQIYNSNHHYARVLLEDWGCIYHHQPLREDKMASYVNMLQDSDKAGYDLVLSSGAVSAGAYDFVQEGLKKIGATILYHKIKLKPGKPNLFAVLPSGGLYFGLPGNPVSTAVGLHFLVGLAFTIITGQQRPPKFYARLTRHIEKKQPLHLILKGQYRQLQDGTMTVDILDGQESFMVHPFVNMNCWVFIDEQKRSLHKDEVVEFYPLSI
ncbi:MAG: molybdopterin molybdotransferase MoeA [Alphaproteobacteria bacterium]|nr:molybdopterin molybdotransferase MoeA [Alphaproteobacteria bacterium]